MSDLLAGIGKWFRDHPRIREAAKPTIDRLVTLLESRRSFRTMPGSYLPHRVQIMRGTYEPAETRFLSARSATAGLILDIGANVGYFAHRMASLAPRSSLVLACEPNPLLTGTLVANVAAFENVRVFPCGLSDTPGPLDLHMAEGEYATASVESAYVELRARHGQSALRAIPCLFTTGSLLLDGLGLGIPDLMKIDVEGWELPALRGFGAMISEARIATILFEVNPGAQRIAGHEPGGVIDFLRAAGYTISRLSNSGDLSELTDAQSDELLRDLGEGGFASLVATSTLTRG